MKSLEKEVAVEFNKGNFVVHKSAREFSAIAIDQAHEQANAVIKGDGGVIGITEDPSALRRWMVAGPEISHLVSEYEKASRAKETPTATRHHESAPDAQRQFLDKAQKLTKVMQDLGNPFQEESSDLLTLDTKDIAHPKAADLINTHYDRGRDQFKEFMEHLEHGDGEFFYQPIKKNNIDFFKHDQVAKEPKQKTLREDCHLFSRLFISCQSRQCDLMEFFKHENQPFPPALSDSGKLHPCQKSQLVDILESQVTKPDTEPEVNALIIDGSAFVNAHPPLASKTFGDYASQDVLPSVKSLSFKYKRIDIVFDVYLPFSLKAKNKVKERKRSQKKGD